MCNDFEEESLPQHEKKIPSKTRAGFASWFAISCLILMIYALHICILGLAMIYYHRTCFR